VKRTLTATIAAALALALAGCGAPAPEEKAEAAETPSGRSVEETLADRVIVPDLAGMASEEAIAALEAVGLTGVVEGDGTEVTHQFPARGTSVEEGTEVSLTVETPEPSGTRDDPFPAGTVLAGSGEAGEEVTVLVNAAVWNSDAAVMAENQYNDPAPAGSTYVLLPVTITNIGSAEAIVPWLDVTVAYVAPDGRSYDEASAVIPGEMRDIGDLYEGGSATGNLVYVLPIDAQGGVWAVSYGWSDPVFVAAS